MKGDLLTKSIRGKLPPLYSQEEVKDPIVHVKFFTPWSNWTWYATEFDGKDTFFGWVVGFEKEFGYFSLSEMQAVRGPVGLKIERDMYFKPKPLSQVMANYGERMPGVDRVPAVIRKTRELSSKPICPTCGGPLEYMGTLGKKEWYRCRNCGMEFYREASPKATKYLPAVSPQTEGLRKLPVFKGYTVDHRLRQFRKVEYGKKPEFISFDSDKGRRLMKEMEGYRGAHQTIHSHLTPERRLLDQIEDSRKSDPDAFYGFMRQIRQEIKNRERGKIKMFPDIGLVNLRNVLKEAEQMYR